MDIGGAAKNIPLGYPTCFLECAAVKNIILKGFSCFILQYIHHDTVVDSARDKDPLKKERQMGCAQRHLKACTAYIS
jgi:hypothetical protein